jgi:predicted nuclease of predicted toxin-antitoxin system
MVPLFADENFSLRVVRELRQLGYDVLTARQAGLASRGTADPDILRAATAGGRAILTNDRRDYMRLHMRDPRHPGIIVCTYDPDAERLAARIHSAISAFEALDGRLIRVTRPGPADLEA